MNLSKSSARLVAEMESHGFYFDALESHSGYYRFTCQGGAAGMHFDTWQELRDYLKSVCWD
jgi:hypothetical protein